MLDRDFLWTDQIYIEGNQAWFVSARGNMLLELDVRNGTVSLVYEFPDADAFKAEQLHTKCIKIGNIILCAPMQSTYFWLYDLETHMAEKVETGVSSAVYAENLICFREKVFFVAKALGEVWEIDLKNGFFCRRYLLIEKEQKRIWDSVIVKNKVYCLYSPIDAVSAEIYEFNMETKNIQHYKLPAVKDTLYAVCYDNGVFWLSGTKKNLYAWEIGKKEVQILDFSSIPLGCYDFEDARKEIIDFDLEKYSEIIFIKLISTERYVCCIPFRTDKILYFDKQRKTFGCLGIDGEEETRESLNGREVFVKYIVEYMREKRYIGLYSTKQRKVIELDADSLEYEIKDYQMDQEVLDAAGRKYLSHKGIYEEEKGSLELLLYALGRQDDGRKSLNMPEETGKKIYQSMKNEKG